MIEAGSYWKSKDTGQLLVVDYILKGQHDDIVYFCFLENMDEDGKHSLYKLPRTDSKQFTESFSTANKSDIVKWKLKQ